MQGTAILFQGQNITFIENVDITLFEELKEQCSCEHCNCRIQERTIDFGTVSPIFWHEDEVDWDYGY